MKTLTEYFVNVSFYNKREEDMKEEIINKDSLDEAILVAKEAVNNAYNNFRSVTARIYQRRDNEAPADIFVFESRKLSV